MNPSNLPANASHGHRPSAARMTSESILYGIIGTMTGALLGYVVMTLTRKPDGHGFENFLIDLYPIAGGFCGLFAGIFIRMLAHSRMGFFSRTALGGLILGGIAALITLPIDKFDLQTAAIVGFLFFWPGALIGGISGLIAIFMRETSKPRNFPTK